MENSKNNVKDKNPHIRTYVVAAKELHIGQKDKTGKPKKSYKRGAEVEFDSRYVGRLVAQGKLTLKK